MWTLYLILNDLGRAHSLNVYSEYGCDHACRSGPRRCWLGVEMLLQKSIHIIPSWNVGLPSYNFRRNSMYQMSEFQKSLKWFEIMLNPNYLEIYLVLLLSYNMKNFPHLLKNYNPWIYRCSATIINLNKVQFSLKWMSKLNFNNFEDEVYLQL